MFSRRRRCTGSSSTIRIRSLIRQPRTTQRVRQLVPNWGTVADQRLKAMLRLRRRRERLAWCLARPRAAEHIFGASRTVAVPRRPLEPCPTDRPMPAKQRCAARAHSERQVSHCRKIARRQAPAPNLGPRAGLGACRNGIWPISMPASTIRRSKRDLDRADADCLAFEEAYKGKLAATGRRRRCRAGARRRRSSATRCSTICSAGSISYAGLVHAGNTVDPARAKFYGDVQERITAASTHLLFFVLELNRIDDAKLEAAMARSRARPLPALARGHPQGQALPARGSHRAAVPREVGDGLFGLEPAVRRDHRRPALQGRRQVAGDRADAQPAAGPEREEPQGGGAGAGRDLQGAICGCSR